MGKKPTLKPVVGQNTGPSIDQELANLQGAYQCCETAIEIVGKQQPVTCEISKFQNCFGWLQQVRQNILGELHSCHERKNRPSPAAAGKPCTKEDADAAPAQSPSVD